ncbi:putative substrate binding protein [Chlamydiales bacterium STE3]|nr:putative substrate binding protein [Chlamydiales bacterium STE3]
MIKEPIVAYFFRWIIILSLLSFMVMLYWSSLLVEENLHIVKQDLKDVKQQLTALKALPNQRLFQEEEKYIKPKIPRKMDPSLPNLLTEDLFYKDTLPKMVGSDFAIEGTRKTINLGKPENLHPFSGWAFVREWWGFCSVGVAKPQTGKYETYSPDMAIKVEERFQEGTGIPEYWVHLRNDVFWQPLEQSWFQNPLTLNSHFLKKHPVTAHDFKFAYDAAMNPFVSEATAVGMRMYYEDLEEFRIEDDFTFVVRWKASSFEEESGKVYTRNKYSTKNLTLALFPLASFVYQYLPDGRKIIEEDVEGNTYKTNSVWAQNFMNHWAKNVIPSCGPWIFDGMTEKSIRFRRNPDYYFPLAVLVDALEVQFKESNENAWQEFKAAGADEIVLRPDNILDLELFLESAMYKKQLSKNLGIQTLKYFDRAFSYIGWNEKNPLFTNKKVRQALTHAIDRKRIIKDILHGMGVETTAPFFPFSPSYDQSIEPLPYDVEMARRLLEEEGWYDSEGEGVLKKEIDGAKVPFEFTLVYFAKSSFTKTIVDYTITALKEVGIRCIPRGVDVADLTAIFDDKNFDACLMAWSLSAPPENPRQLWHSASAQEKGSANAIGFANKEIDQIIDTLDFEYDPQKRLQLYHKFHQILYDEMPYTFLYVPKVALVYREYLQNVFIPAERQDLIPGANMVEPLSELYWIKR